ncbi:MAG: PrgI family protein [Candidatus Paceibacterota bacterium]|jgi:hypothetical protein
MQFKVPQFIDIQDKLFGPFTFHQFAYLVGGAGIIFVIYKLLPLWIGIFLMIPIAILSALLVFYKINGKPFIFYLQAGISYLISSKLYIWKQRLVKPGDKTKEEEAPTPSLVSVLPMTSENKLKDLAWSLDVQDKDESSK